MSEADAHWEKIEKLAEAETFRIVDYTPYATGDDFRPLHDYMEEYFRPIFAEKMAMLLLLVAYRYSDSVIYVEGTDWFYKQFPGLERDLNVRHFEPEKLVSYIRKIIADDIGVAFLVYVPGNNCLIRITGGFSTEIYADDEEFLNLLDALAKQQGLFIRELSKNDW
ncbi:hypothetical protein [Dermatophilus congolensis]|uniref:Uncharacterized protein n=1 Tax=Dermatophilus congolensis TaxID=1863 RepID=A0A239VP99_9MICO|nr:hypothetical protein [Dermatophilus congolensis]MBO3129583.1 hypothetical protein [Dermatophilus congolensis]MBO3131784.1 hypothetical protein [Dermatophilus congolensis]MBO3134058.1 hypothetical protein [Dermatophilus congolensis]MBO3136291.1 hypothetical protein [Dermatophilus congolensis]MBO3138539.1 hypothetical protein [Dermatophilus congolensis]